MAESQALVSKKKEISTLIERPGVKEQMQRAMTGLGITPGRMTRTFLTCVFKNPKLMKCTQDSLLACLIQTAELGLEPGDALQHAFVVPYGESATIIIGYRGLMALARRSGEIKSFDVNIVYKDEVDSGRFKYTAGLHPDIKHDVMLDCNRDDNQVQYVYAVAELKDGGYQHVAMTKNEVDKIRSMSKQPHGFGWKNHYQEMTKKTAIRRLFKLLPASIIPPIAHEILDNDPGNMIKDVTATVLEPGSHKVDKGGVAEESKIPTPEAPAATQDELDETEKGKIGNYKNLLQAELKKRGKFIDDLMFDVGFDEEEWATMPSAKVKELIDYVNAKKDW